MLIGARTAAWGGGGGGWTNPYVTDGLVFCFDFENNGGMVKDIVSGEVLRSKTGIEPYIDADGWLNFNGYCYLEKNLEIDSNTNAITVQNVELSSDRTVNSIHGRVGIGNIYLGNQYSISSTVVSDLSSYRTGYPLDAGRTIARSATFYKGFTCESKCEVYENGARKSLERYWGTPSAALFESACKIGSYSSIELHTKHYKYGSIRIYNRELTADEISFNFEADNSRFTLT